MGNKLMKQIILILFILFFLPSVLGSSYLDYLTYSMLNGEQNFDNADWFIDILTVNNLTAINTNIENATIINYNVTGDMDVYGTATFHDLMCIDENCISSWDDVNVSLDEYWKSDGSSTATGDWDIGTYDLSAENIYGGGTDSWFNQTLLISGDNPVSRNSDATLIIQSEVNYISCINLTEGGNLGFQICYDGTGGGEYVIRNMNGGTEYMTIDRDSGGITFHNETTFENVIVHNITTVVVTASAIRSTFSDGSIDIRGDPWYLTDTDLQIAENLIVDNNITADKIFSNNISVTGDICIAGNCIDNWDDINQSLDGYAKYQFGDNNFNGSGSFKTTGTGTFEYLAVGTIIGAGYVVDVIGAEAEAGVSGEQIRFISGQGHDDTHALFASATAGGHISLIGNRGGNGANGSIVSFGGAGSNINILSGAGGTADDGTGGGDAIAGSAGNYFFTAADGGKATGAKSNTGGYGGSYFMASGNGGEASTGTSNTGGSAGNFYLIGGIGGKGGGDTAGDITNGGTGGGVIFTAGNGGTGSGGSTNAGGEGGGVAFRPGKGGTGTTVAGVNGQTSFYSNQRGTGIGLIAYFDNSEGGSHDFVLTQDNQRLLFGESKDASIYYDGSDLKINPQKAGSGSLKVLGDLNVTENVRIYGNTSFSSPHLDAFDNTTQTFQTLGTAQVMNLTYGNYHSYQIDIIDRQNITFDRIGHYEVCVSPQFYQASGVNKEIEFWLQKNGVDVEWSNTRYTMDNDEYEAPRICWETIITNPATDNVRIMWLSDSTSSSIQSITGLTDPIRPSVPGVIIDVHWISNGD